MPPTYPAQAVPQNAYPTPPRFVGAVVKFLVIAALDRLARRVIARLGRRRPAPQAQQTPLRTERGDGRAHR